MDNASAKLVSHSVTGSFIFILDVYTYMPLIFCMLKHFIK